MYGWRIGLGALILLGLLVSVVAGDSAQAGAKVISCGQRIVVSLNKNGVCDAGADAGKINPSLSSLVAPFQVGAVLSSNGPGIDSGAEVFDVSSAGRMLPYAAGSDALGGFGRIHGGIYFNHDGTNLYVGVAGYSKQAASDGEDALLVLLDVRPGGVDGLEAIQSGPRGLRVASNLRFQAGTFEPDIALLLGNRRIDGRNDWTAQLGGKEYGQGVFSLSGNAAGDLAPAFTESGPSPISQWGDSPCSTDLANAGIEVAIPLGNLLATAWTAASTTCIRAAAIVIGGDDGGRRFLSSEAYGESVSGGFGYDDATLIGAPVVLSTLAAPESCREPLFDDSEVMIQGFGWNVPRPLRCYYSGMAVTGLIDGHHEFRLDMTPIGDDVWERIASFPNGSRLDFHFVAEEAAAAYWGQSNWTARVLPVASGFADYRGERIGVHGSATGTLRFRFNSTSQHFSIEAVPENTFTATLPGYAQVYWYCHLERMAKSNQFARFSRVWMPPPQKGMNAAYSAGYDPYDYYDLGRYNQGGAIETRYGSEEELKRCVSVISSKGIECIADMVLNHMRIGAIDSASERSGNCKIHEEQDAGANGNGGYNVDPVNYPFQSDHGFGLYTNTQVEGSYFVAHCADVNELNSSMRNGLKKWTGWLESTVGFRGCRLDFTQGMQPFFFSEFMSAAPMNGQFAVMEYWTDGAQASAREHETWIHLVDRRACSFDMPLREKLERLCNSDGDFNLEDLSSGALIHVESDRAVTFVESHDTIRPFAEGGYCGVRQDKNLAYAFILFSEGYPCVFYQDYFGQPYADKTSETGWRGREKELRPFIDEMIDIRQRYAGGSTTYLSTENTEDLFVAKRNGTSIKDGCILALNDHIELTLTNTVDVGWPEGAVLVDALDPSHMVSVQANGLASLSAPCRGCRVYVRKENLDEVTSMHVP